MNSQLNGGIKVILFVLLNNTLDTYNLYSDYHIIFYFLYLIPIFHGGGI